MVRQKPHERGSDTVAKEFFSKAMQKVKRRGKGRLNLDDLQNMYD
jgi:hypothetical protein